MAEIRKLRSANLWQTIFAASNDAMLLIDENLAIRACNPRALELYGYAEQELIGTNLTDLRTLSQRAALEQQLREARRKGGLVFETEHLTRDGSVLQVEVSTHPLKLGTRPGWFHIIRDIRDRKHAEQEREHLLQAEQQARRAAEQAQDRLAFLAEVSTELASTLDYDKILSSVAHLAVPRIADWCSIHMLEQDGSLHLAEIVHVDPDKVRWALELRDRFPVDSNGPNGVPNVIRTGKSEFYPEIPDALLTAVARSEEELHLMREVGFTAAILVPLVARGGRVVGAISVVSAESGRRYTPADFTLAEELARHAALAIENARLYKESQEAVHARDMFISVASHELKTPLTIIQGYAELLKRQLGSAQPIPIEQGQGLLAVNQAQLERRIDNIYDATGRLTKLINELLDVNRMQRGAIELNPERVDLTALLSNVIQNVVARDQVAERPRRVRIITDCPSHPLWGTWDRSRLEQVFTNLIDNAVKYSPLDSTVEVTLREEQADSDEATSANDLHQAHFIVRDRGIGIPQEEIGLIFQPFMRATNAARLKFPGLGLGLAISREIVEHHGGRIWVESTGPNEGSSFHVLLPGVEPNQG